MFSNARKTYTLNGFKPGLITDFQPQTRFLLKWLSRTTVYVLFVETMEKKLNHLFWECACTKAFPELILPDIENNKIIIAQVIIILTLIL